MEDLTTFNIGHFFFLVLWSIFIGLVGCCTVRSRVYKRRRALHRIGGSDMPITKSAVGKRQANIILRELTSSVGTKEKMAPKVEDYGFTQVGWGKPAEYEGVHFKTTIAKSYLVLERAAGHRNPELVMKPHQTVREWVFALEKQCPGIKHRFWTNFVEYYERARFGCEEITVAEFREFMKQFVALIQHFEGEPDDEDQLSKPASSTFDPTSWRKGGGRITFYRGNAPLPSL